MAQTLHCLYGVETCSSAASLPKDPKLPAIMKLMLIEYLTIEILLLCMPNYLHTVNSMFSHAHK